MPIFKNQNNTFLKTFQDQFSLIWKPYNPNLYENDRWLIMRTYFGSLHNNARASISDNNRIIIKFFFLFSVILSTISWQSKGLIPQKIQWIPQKIPFSVESPLKSAAKSIKLKRQGVCFFIPIWQFFLVSNHLRALDFK